jgi:phage baseplate assembly protein W
MSSRVFSTEDGNLVNSIITTKSADYIDLDLSFSKKVNGDVYKRLEVEAVKQSVKNILMTNQGEKPFKPSFGGNLTGLLFELINDPVIKSDIKRSIISQIEAYEPRATISDVQVVDEPDYNSINVTVEFIVKSLNKQVSITTSILRLR